MSRTILPLALALAAFATTPGHAADTPPVVVELFTSQGCSSCPPANANLIKLSQRSDVLALSFAVTYWDYLGWKDSFGKEIYTDRQRIYEPPLGQAGPYTPQMVFNGATTAVGNNFAQVEQLVASATPLSGPAVDLGEGRVAIGPATAPPAAADVWLVRYDPNLVEVPVARGENTGRTLPHTHVVHVLQRLGAWDGKATAFDIAAADSGLSTAILVQAVNGGPILAAATN